MSDLSTFYCSIPPITRFFVTAPAIVLALNRFQLFLGEPLFWDYNLTRFRYQLWRAITGFVVIHPDAGGLSVLFDLHSCCLFSRTLEQRKFKSDIAAYIFYFLIVGPIILCTTYFTECPFLFDVLLSALRFNFSRYEPNRMMKFFVISFKAAYLPYIIMSVDFVSGGMLGLQLNLSGFFAGYVYSCLENRNAGPLVSLAASYIRRYLPVTGTSSNYEKSARIAGMEEFGDVSYVPAPSWLRGVVTKLAGFWSSSSSSSSSSSDLRSGSARGYTAGGHRLGSLDEKSNSNSGSNTDSASGISTGANRRPGAGAAAKFFPGKGQKLGS